MVLKYVITGAPGSGKGGLAKAIAAAGEEVRYDVCSQVLSGVSEPWRNPNFQRRVMNSQLEMETALEGMPAESRVFLDKGVIDSLVYNLVSGSISPMMCGQRVIKLTHPYEIAFMLELPPEEEYHAPWSGVKDWKHAKKIEQMLIDQYLAAECHGISKIVTVSRMPPEDMARMVIACAREYESGANAETASSLQHAL